MLRSRSDRYYQNFMSFHSGRYSNVSSWIPRASPWQHNVGIWFSKIKLVSWSWVGKSLGVHLNAINSWVIVVHIQWPASNSTWSRLSLVSIVFCCTKLGLHNSRITRHQLHPRQSWTQSHGHLPSSRSTSHAFKKIISPKCLNLTVLSLQMNQKYVKLRAPLPLHLSSKGDCKAVLAVANMLCKAQNNIFKVWKTCETQVCALSIQCWPVCEWLPTTIREGLSTFLIIAVYIHHGQEK